MAKQKPEVEDAGSITVRVEIRTPIDWQAYTSQCAEVSVTRPTKSVAMAELTEALDELKSKLSINASSANKEELEAATKLAAENAERVATANTLLKKLSLDPRTANVMKEYLPSKK